MAERGFLALPTDMECDEPLASPNPAGGVAGPVLALSHDELRHVFCFVPDLDRRALQRVCKTWAQVGKTCGPLMTSATVDAAEYAMRRGRRLDWTAACTWLNQHLHGRPTLSLRLPTGCHDMPSSGLLGALPAFAGTLRTLHLHLGAPGLTSRDVVGLGRLTQLRELTMHVQIMAEVLVTGLQQLRSLSSLTHLSFDAVSRPPLPAKPVHPDDFPTPDYAAQYPSGRLYAPFCLDMANMPHLQSFRFVADPCAVNFDTLPPGLTSLSALTSLHLNNCFAEAEPHAFCGPPQLQHLALEDFKFQTPRPPPVTAPGTPVAPHPLDKLGGLSSLRQLSLQRCQLDASGVKLVAQLLPQLEELDVGGNLRLEQHGLAEAAEALDSW